jgi:hypothetical protein
MNKIIALWSVPRSLSTTAEQVMRQRGDFEIIHQPFGFLYYQDNPKVKSPFPNVKTYEDIKNNICSTAKKHDVFFKGMCHFCDEFLTDIDFIQKLINTFIIRNPAKTILSHYKLNPDVTSLEIGNERQYQLFQRTISLGKKPIIIDADDLENQPINTIKLYCNVVGIPFIQKALTWKATPGKNWGVGDAAHWYKNIAESTGIKKQTDIDHLATINKNPKLKIFYDYHLPFYQEMYKYRLITKDSAHGK